MTNAPARTRTLLLALLGAVLDAGAWLLIGLFVGACGWELVGSPRGSIHIGPMIVVAVLSGLATSWLIRRHRTRVSPRKAIDWPRDWPLDWPLDWRVTLDLAAALVVGSFVALTGWMLALGGPSPDEYHHPRTIMLVFVGNLPFAAAGTIWLIVRYSQRLTDRLRQK